MSQWYLLQCKARQESRARQHIENQGYMTCLPLRRVSKIVRGRRQVSEEALFPGYLFIEIDLETANFNAIRSTRGVRGMVRFGGIPAKVPERIIRILRDTDNANTETEFTCGTPVRITSGPFSGLEAVYSMSKGEDRCLVLLNMMGKQQQIELQETTLRKL